jgi:superfamily II DNA or RNA helicase
MRVVVRDEEWLIKKVTKNTLLKQEVIHCLGLSPLIKDNEGIYLVDVEEVVPLEPTQINLVIDDTPFFRRSRLFVESLWRRQVPTDSGLYVGDKGAMDLLKFQLEPAQLALRNLRRRILIADGVGLGKTLEAGILISELIARGKGRRILVVTVKSMMLQFQKELWNRFSIPLIRLDSALIYKTWLRLPDNHNPFFHFDKTIVSIDTLKRKLDYRSHLEKAYWDIIVIDEAHNVAERGIHQAQRAELAKLLSKRSDTLIMLSATPHDGRAESFASLMNMLDPTAIANVHDYVKEEISGLCVRRFKKDVREQITGAFQDRDVRIEDCQATNEEEVAFEFLANLRLEMDDNPRRRRFNGTLFKTSLEKALFSSPFACLKSVDERLKKLDKKFEDKEFGDIKKLNLFRVLLEKIDSSSFSRYQTLLKLLRDQDYGWTKLTDDRLVIFTERVETLKFLGDNLPKDAGLSQDAVKVLYGELSDIEQQKIIEDFGRENSPIRVLVSTDVGSEGINLHYLSHRLIHFDIPWSLMVFQQRNGRVDRYGQTKRPDIRYLRVDSFNHKIKGDGRILEILVKKEDQAYKNIGDPTLLMGLFSVEEEVLTTATAMENDQSPEAFANELDQKLKEFDPLELLINAATPKSVALELKEKETLFKDIDYLETALEYFGEPASLTYRKMDSVEGLIIQPGPDMARRLDAILPDEVKPEDGWLRLSPDKSYCLEEMKRSLQNNLSESAWPTVQYLWRLHPVIDWLSDRAGLLYRRNEAPLVATTGLTKSEVIFVMMGLISNRKASPVVDSWFGLNFLNGQFEKELPVERVFQLCGYNDKSRPNQQVLTEADRAKIQDLIPLAVEKAKAIMDKRAAEYTERVEPLIDAELNKLGELEKKKKIALSRDASPKNQQSSRDISDTFESFAQFIHDSMELEINPYLRIVVAFVGV